MKLLKLRCLLTVGLCCAAFLTWLLLYQKTMPPKTAGVQSAQTEEGGRKQNSSGEKNYIKWVDFTVPSEALNDAYQYDIETYGDETHVDWIPLLACLAAQNGGDFSHYTSSRMDETVNKLINKEETMDSLTQGLKYYNYYLEAYDAVLGGMVGEYEIASGAEDTRGGEPQWEQRYGLKAFHPLAKDFPYSDYDDFGVSRSYGYKRQHLGHDMMGAVGTPTGILNGTISRMLQKHSASFIVFC